MAAATYSFRLYTKSELAGAQDKLAAILCAWAAEWFPEARPEAVKVLDLGGIDALLEPSKTWASCAGGKLEGPIVDKSADVLKCVAGALAGELAKAQPVRFPLSPVLASTTEQVLIDLLVRLKGEVNADGIHEAKFGDAVTAQIAGLHCAGSGALLCSFNLAETGFRLIVDTPTAERFIPAKAPAPKGKKRLSQVLDAVSKEQIRTNLMLGHAELSVTEFVGLNVGDVILLDRKIGQPFVLCTNRGSVLANVQIGIQGSRVAAAIVGKS